jgi:hypothetical protein
MIHKEHDYKKNSIRVIFLFSILAIAFIAGILLMNRRVERYNYLQYHEAMDTTLIIHPVIDRGGLFYDNYEYVLNSKSILVENNDGYDTWNLKSKANPSLHRLGSLPGPYYIYKAAYNDTLVVIKDGCVMKFKMPVLN